MWHEIGRLRYLLRVPETKRDSAFSPRARASERPDAHPITLWRSYSFETVRGRESKKERGEAEEEREGGGEGGNRGNGSGRIFPVRGMKNLSQPVELHCAIAQSGGGSPVHDEHHDPRRENTDSRNVELRAKRKKQITGRTSFSCVAIVLARIYLAYYKYVKVIYLEYE